MIYPKGMGVLFRPGYATESAVHYEAIIVEHIHTVAFDYDYRVEITKVIEINGGPLVSPPSMGSRHRLREQVLTSHREIRPLLRTPEEIEAFLAP